MCFCGFKLCCFNVCLFFNSRVHKVQSLVQKTCIIIYFYKSHSLLKWPLNALQLYVTYIQYLHNQCPIHDHWYLFIAVYKTLSKTDGHWIRKTQITKTTVFYYIFFDQPLQHRILIYFEMTTHIQNWHAQKLYTSQ